MSYRRGHTTGHKRERRALQAAIRRYEALAATITQALQDKTPDELLAYARQQLTQKTIQAIR